MFSTEQVAAWVRDKDAQWDDVGYGPWAITVDGRLVGWSGFQREENGPTSLSSCTTPIGA